MIGQPHCGGFARLRGRPDDHDTLRHDPALALLPERLRPKRKRRIKIARLLRT
ncbi:hypothetical protein SJ05684_b50460 (plasmid) [Sinorhizobium sojae CCBAU 05684]|uniref:Uncharacterized protein n=1 Tax=Sinorhizobium sojae CCBAU 05684 TaxID=716928 RepID=A0A249PJD6_9HYPH|nr:hypothetical protein SJ05684_b50460 [Sinorhizobium sojae CCBAU 05684]